MILPHSAAARPVPSLLPSAASPSSPARPAKPAGPHPAEGWIVGAALLLAFLLAAAPVLIAAAPPFFDYPNHLARVDAMRRFATDPLLRDNFRLSSFLLPNVLSDAVLLGLMQLASPRTAGRLLVLLTFALQLGGIALLARAAHGRWSPWSVLAALFLLNEMVFWGFLNYNLGLALLPLGLAAWLFLADRPAWQRLLVGALFALLIFLAHLVAFGLYAVATIAIELGRGWHRRQESFQTVLERLGLAVLQLVPAAVLHVAASPASGLPLDIRFDYSAWGKVSPFYRILASGNAEPDRYMLVAAIALALLGLASFRARLDVGLTLAALLFAGMVLVLPYAALGSFFLDSRIAVAVAFTLIAALGPGRLRLPGTLLVCLLALALVGGRGALLAVDWRGQNRAIAEAVAGFEALPAGALLVSASSRPFELGDWWETRYEKPPHEHLAAYAAIDRHVLVPNLYAKPGQNPLVFEPPLAEVAALNRNPIARTLDEGQLRAFVAAVEAAARARAAADPAGPGTYVAVWHRVCSDWPAGLPVRPVVCGTDFTIAEVLPGVVPAAPASAAR